MTPTKKTGRRWFPPSLAYPLYAIGIILVLSLLYYFPNVSSQEAYLDAQSLRILTEISEQLSGRLSSLEAVANNTTAERLKKLPGTPSLQDFLKAQAPKLKPLDRTKCDSNFICGCAPGASQCIGMAWDMALRQLVEESEQGSFEDMLLADADGHVLAEVPQGVVRIHDLSAVFPKEPEEKAPAEQKFTVTLAPKNGKEQSKSENTGIVYPKQREFTTVNIREVAGSRYRVYLAPVKTPVTATARGLTLCGLTAQREFRRRTLALPANTVTLSSLAILIVCCAGWPLLKLQTMRRTTRVPRLAGLRLMASTVVTIGLLLIFLFDVDSTLGVHGREGNRRRLNEFANDIDRHLGDELHRILIAMQDVERTRNVEAVKAPASDGKNCSDEREPRINFQQDILSKDPIFHGAYPYLDHFFWADQCGWQRVKWTVQQTPTPQTRVTQFPLFEEARSGHLWTLPDGSDSRFRVDPLYSPNNAEYLAVITRRSGIEPMEIQSVITPLASLIRPVIPEGFGFAIIDPDGNVLFHSSPAKNGRENFFQECRESADIRNATLLRLPIAKQITYLGEPHYTLLRPLEHIRGCPWTLVAFREAALVKARSAEAGYLMAFMALAFYLVTVTTAWLFAWVARRKGYPSGRLWPQAKHNGAYLALSIFFILVSAAVFAWWRVGSEAESFGAVIAAPLVCVIFTGLKLAPAQSTEIGTGSQGWRKFMRPEYRIALFTTAIGMLASLYAVYGGRVRLGPWLPIVLFMIGGYLLQWRWLTCRLMTLQLGKLRMTTKTRYALASACLSVTLALVPCLYFLKVALSFEERAFRKSEEVLARKALALRDKRVEERYQEIRFFKDASLRSEEEPGATERALFLRRRLREFEDDVHGMTIVGGGRPKDSLEDRWFRPLLQIIEALPNAGASMSRQLAVYAPPAGQHGRSSGGAYDPGESNFVQFHRRTGSPLNASVPDELPFQMDSSVVVTILVLFLLIWAWLRSTLSKLFVLERPPLLRWNRLDLQSCIDRCRAGRNVIAVGLPFSGKSRSLEGDPHVRRVDIAALLQHRGFAPEHWRSFRETTIALDHFGYEMDDREANRKKLEILESLVYGSGKQVLIITTVDPLYYLRSPRLADSDGLEDDLTPGADLDRWAKALMGFEWVRIEASGPPDLPDLTAYYLVLWSNCTVQERVVLFQLANDGWVNYKNHGALQQLVDRGLVESTQEFPAFHLADEGLTSFLGSEERHQEARRWQREEGPSPWDGLAGVFIILASVLAGLVLLLFQQHLWAILLQIFTLLVPLVRQVAQGRAPAGEGSASA